MQQEEIRKLEDVIRRVKDLNVVFNGNHSNSCKYDVKIVTTEEEIIKLAKVVMNANQLAKING
ncbi:MAG: hypothetical protein J7L39_03650 [Candidatus Aenigmarchaeota archaeon]|nr:hypothetical protein [Candidatus Aenigmarchaeota archaeon]